MVRAMQRKKIIILCALMLFSASSAYASDIAINPTSGKDGLFNIVMSNSNNAFCDSYSGSYPEQVFVMAPTPFFFAPDNGTYQSLGFAPNCTAGTYPYSLQTGYDAYPVSALHGVHKIFLIKADTEYSGNFTTDCLPLFNDFNNPSLISDLENSTCYKTELSYNWSDNSAFSTNLGNQVAGVIMSGVENVLSNNLGQCVLILIGLALVFFFIRLGKNYLR